MQLVKYFKEFNLENISTKAYRVLIVLIWTQYTLFNYVEAILNRLPYINIFTNYVFPILIILSLIMAWPKIKKRIRISDLLFYLVLILFVLISYLFLTENAVYIQNDFLRMIFNVFPFYFIGLIYSHEDSKKDLFLFSLIGVIIAFLYQIYYISSGRIVETDNMDAAYKSLPSVLFLIYYAFENKEKKYWLFVIFGLILELIYGTRGPILIIVSFLAIEIIFRNIKKYKNKGGIIFALILLIIFVLIFFLSSLFIDFINWLSNIFEEMGFSTRIFDYFLAGNMADDNGRNEITNAVINAILQNPFGNGIFGDRIVTDGSYAHNIFLEIWCQFGLMFGSALLVIIILIPVKALLKIKKTNMLYLFLMFFLMVFIKLFLSGSYLVESWLLFLIGISISILRTNKVYCEA